MRVLLCITVLLSLTGAAQSEEGRAEHWRRLREEKQARAAPPKRPWLERRLIALERGERPSILDFNYKGVYPTVTTINKDSRTAFGARLWQPDIAGSPVDVYASGLYSLRSYELYNLSVGSLQHAGREMPVASTRGDDVFELGGLPRRAYSRLILFGNLRYRDYPQEDFFGSGSDSRRSDESNFALEEYMYEVVLGYQVNRHLTLSLRPSFLDISIGPGQDDSVATTQQRYDEETAPGLGAQPDFLVLNTQAFLDYRDEALNAHRGGMLAVAWSRFDGRDANRYDFDRFALDARGYLPLGSPQRVLALRGFFSTVSTDASARVPFYLQETLGGKRNLRSYPNFRFRGDHVLNVQAEYRWEGMPNLEFAVFADGGKITDNRSDLGLADMRVSYGFGVRIKLPERVLLRVDFAGGDEGSRLLLHTGPSF